MKAVRLTLVVGAVLISASPVLPQFVKAALGFRLGYSPTEHGYNQKINYGGEKKGVGVQVLTGANNGGWHQGGLQAAGSNHGSNYGSNYGSGYGVGIGGGREGPLAAHVGHGAVRHLRILGLNLYLGGRAAHLGQGLQQHKAPLKKPFHLPAIKPLSLFGIRPSVHIGLKQNGQPHTVGANTGLRAAVGTHDYGVGFKVGYRQGINTKSPLAQVLLGDGGAHGKYSYVPTTHKGQDQIYMHGNSLLKGHGHNNHNQFSGWGQLDSPVAGLESKHHFSTQPLQQHGRLQQLQPQGPIRIPYIPQHNGRTILRPTPIQYTFNGPQQALPSGPVRMVLAPHPQSPLQQHSRPHNAPRWSTIFQANGPQPAASNHFVNPLPPNGQPLSKLQASLHSPVASAQNQASFIQPQHQQPQYQQYQSYPSYGYQQGSFAQPTRHQNNFHQHYPQQSTAQQYQFPQEYNLFQQHHLNSPLQQYQHNSPSHFNQQPQHNQQQQQQQHSQSQIPQQSPFFSQIQEQPLSSPQQLDQPAHQQQQQQQHQSQSSPLNSNFPNLPQLPFTADSMQFQPDPGFQYTHSTSSDPVSMGSYTMDMDLGQGSGSENAAGPLVGPLGRRLKKAKRARADVIIKKSDTLDTKDLETSASNAIFMASSMGATSWTPLVIADPPQFSKKSLETPTPTPEMSHHQVQEAQVIKPKSEAQQAGAIIAVVPAAASAEHSQDRSMILKKRRLNVSGEVTGPTVIPTTTLPTTTSTTKITTTTTPTTTTTTPLPTSSTSTSSIPTSSLAPSSPSPSSSSSSAEAASESTSESSSLTTVIV